MCLDQPKTASSRNERQEALTLSPSEITPPYQWTRFIVPLERRSNASSCSLWPPGENHLVPSGRTQTLGPAPPHPATVSAVSRAVAVETSGWAGQPGAWDTSRTSSAKYSVGVLLGRSSQPDFTHLPSVKKVPKVDWVMSSYRPTTSPFNLALQSSTQTALIKSTRRAIPYFGLASTLFQNP